MLDHHGINRSHSSVLKVARHARFCSLSTVVHRSAGSKHSMQLLKQVMQIGLKGFAQVQYPRCGGGVTAAPLHPFLGHLAQFSAEG
mmetsp:Transcript_6480/g.13467  ORF Transcript_6480/g.13467 Transcript_6480/m.13467 type:complete len:86 (-) Transcript_6480:469-726(-)